MTEADRIIAAAASAGLTLTPERAAAAAVLVRAMEEADRTLAGLGLTEPPSGPDSSA